MSRARPTMLTRAAVIVVEEDWSDVEDVLVGEMGEFDEVLVLVVAEHGAGCEAAGQVGG
jgi:hypothetical protein